MHREIARLTSYNVIGVRERESELLGSPIADKETVKPTVAPSRKRSRRGLTAPLDLYPGTRVRARCHGSFNQYAGTIRAELGGGLFDVLFDDGTTDHRVPTSSISEVISSYHRSASAEVSAVPVPKPPASDPSSSVAVTKGVNQEKKKKRYKSEKAEKNIAAHRNIAARDKLASKHSQSSRSTQKAKCGRKIFAKRTRPTVLPSWILASEMSKGELGTTDEVGQMVRVYWDGDRRWYEAQVVGFKRGPAPRSFSYTLEYIEDGTLSNECLTAKNDAHWQFLRFRPRDRSAASSSTSSESGEIDEEVEIRSKVGGLLDVKSLDESVQSATSGIRAPTGPVTCYVCGKSNPLYYSSALPGDLLVLAPPVPICNADCERQYFEARNLHIVGNRPAINLVVQTANQPAVQPSSSPATDMILSRPSATRVDTADGSALKPIPSAGGPAIQPDNCDDFETSSLLLSCYFQEKD